MINSRVIVLVNAHIKHTMNKSIVKHILIFILRLIKQILLLLILLHQILLSWVPIFLFPFNIFEHVLVFRQIHVIWENFWELLIKLYNSRHSFHSFNFRIVSFQKLTHVVVNQIVFKHRNYVWAFIVYNVIDHFHIIVSSTCQILLFKVRS